MAYRLDELEDGLYPDIPGHIYHQRVLGTANKSALDQVERSAAHYLAWLNGQEEKPTPAMLFGSAFHMGILEPERFMETYIVEPEFGDCRFKENKARRDAWRQSNGIDDKGRLPSGKILISPEDADHIGGMAEAIRNHPVVGGMIRDGFAEHTIKWTDEATGLVCKCRPDYYVPSLKMVVDLKSTQDARPDAFAKSVAEFRYHVQEAFYRDGFAAIGEEITAFLFVAIEKKSPYAIRTYNLDEEALVCGAEEKDANMAALASAIKTGEFPSYTSSIEPLALPRYYVNARRRST
jgi:exodeoxyribonuclease VIII